MTTPQPSTLSDDLDQFFRKQQFRIRVTLARRVRRIEAARDAARSEDVMSDALIVTRRGTTYGGASVQQDNDS